MAGETCTYLRSRHHSSLAHMPLSTSDCVLITAPGGRTREVPPKDSQQPIQEKGLLSCSLPPWGFHLNQAHTPIPIQHTSTHDRPLESFPSEFPSKDQQRVVSSLILAIHFRSNIPFPFMGNLWFVCAVNFNVHLWHAQTINFHERKTDCSNATEIDCSTIYSLPAIL